MLMVVLSTQGPSAQATGMDGKMDPATPLGPRVPARTRRWTLPEKPDTHVHMRYMCFWAGTPPGSCDRGTQGWPRTS